MTYGLTHRRPHVPENDTPLNEPGLVESACASSSMSEPYFRNSGTQEDIMKQSGKPQPLRNGEDGSFIIKG